MRRLVTWNYWGLLVLGLSSCTSPQGCFLRGAVNHETLAVVAQHLGQPHEVWSLADGETLWSYRIDQSLWAYWRAGHTREIPVGLTVEGPGLTLLPRAPCTEYVLRFDRDQILRTWRRQPCQGFKPGPVSHP